MLDKIIQKLKNLIPKKKPADEKKVETAAPAPASPPAPGKEAANLDPKAKKRQLIIKIVAGIAILYFALDEFVLKKEPEEEPPKPVARAERKPKKALKDLQKPPEEAAARDVASVPPAETPKVTPKAPAPEVRTAPPGSPPVHAPEAAPAPEAVSAPQKAPVETVSEPTKTPEEVTTSPEPKSVGTETPGEPADLTMAAEGPATTMEKPTEEIAKDMEKVAQEVGPIPEEEIKPAEKVELPDYSIKGRGLVYNCHGKHWACIDRAGYLNCKEHMRWTEENKKAPECVIKNVYASEDDCSVVQLYYINTNEPSDFCKKN